MKQKVKLVPKRCLFYFKALSSGTRAVSMTGNKSTSVKPKVFNEFLLFFFSPPCEKRHSKGYCHFSTIHVALLISSKGIVYIKGSVVYFSKALTFVHYIVVLSDQNTTFFYIRLRLKWSIRTRQNFKLSMKQQF